MKLPEPPRADTTEAAARPQTTASVSRTERRPTSVRFGRLRPWRWDVTTFELREGQNPGVYDKWVHLSQDCGHAVTWLGARFAAWRRSIR